MDSQQVEKIQFVTSENGTSCMEILSVLTSASLLPTMSILLFPWLVPSTFTVKSKPDVLTHQFVRFILEFPLIALLTGALLTFLAEPAHSILDFQLSKVVTATLGFSLLLIPTVNHTMSRPKWKNLQDEWKQIKLKSVGWACDRGNKMPFLTNFRGMILYLTVFTILAVDFWVFPRRFAKTKKFGMSLMDLGTASFVFSNGIVAPEAKGRRGSLKKALGSCVPLLVLGFARLAAVKGTEYHEVVEEYGVHWNFFFTLTAVKIFSSTLFSFLASSQALVASTVLAILYEFYLTFDNKLDLYLLNPEISRSSSLLDANREGIYSSFGYLSIYLSSVYIGHLIYKKARKTVEDWTQFIIELLPLLGFLWCGFWVSHNYWIPVCRRAGNLSYIFWSLALNLTVLVIHIVLDLSVFVMQSVGVLHGPMISYQLYKKNMKGEGKYFEGPGKVECVGEDEEIERDLEELEKEVTGLESYGKDVEVSKPDLGVLEQRLRRIGTKLVEERKKEDDELDSIDRISCLPNLAGESLFYKAVCFNGLVVFLLGNLLTGLVNFVVRTESASGLYATGVLLIYTLAIYFASFGLYAYNIQLKCW